jgi:hypothetical protein
VKGAPVKVLVMDSADDANYKLSCYYWKNGSLESILQYRLGSFVEEKGASKSSDGFLFSSGKLFGWRHTPAPASGSAIVDPASDAFREKASAMPNAAAHYLKMVTEELAKSGKSD